MNSSTLFQHVLPLDTQHATSVVYTDANRTVAVKKYVKFQDYHPMQREICALDKLSAYNWSAKLLCVGHDYIVTTYKGSRLCTENAPRDARLQMRTILQNMRSMRLRHNDLRKSHTDFLVQRGRVSLVDFGLSTGLWGRLPRAM